MRLDIPAIVEGEDKLVSLCRRELLWILDADLDPAAHDICVGERGKAALEPIRLRPAVRVDESEHVAARRLDAGVAGLRRALLGRMHDAAKSAARRLDRSEPAGGIV